MFPRVHFKFAAGLPVLVTVSGSATNRGGLTASCGIHSKPGAGRPRLLVRPSEPLRHGGFAGHTVEAEAGAAPRAGEAVDQRGESLPRSVLTAAVEGGVLPVGGNK